MSMLDVRLLDALDIEDCKRVTIAEDRDEWQYGCRLAVSVEVVQQYRPLSAGEAALLRRAHMRHHILHTGFHIFQSWAMEVHSVQEGHNYRINSAQCTHFGSRV